MAGLDLLVVLWWRYHERNLTGLFLISGSTTRVKGTGQYSLVLCMCYVQGLLGRGEIRAVGKLRYVSTPPGLWPRRCVEPDAGEL